MSYRPLLLCLLVILLYLPASAHSGHLESPGTIAGFIENKGQVTDQYGTARTDIGFKLSATGGLNIFIGTGQLHYQWVKGKPRLDRFAGSARREEQSVSPAPIDLYRMDVELIGADPHAEVTTESGSAYYERYYLPATGDNGIVARSFQHLIYHNVYPGIDWVVYLNESGQLEHDFVIRPGAKVADIRIKYSGATALNLDTDGSLKAVTPFGEIREAVPYAYDQDNGKKVNTRYVLNGKVLSFSAAQNKGTLVIDPVVIWGSYFGGSDADMIYDMVIGKDSTLYVTGGTSSTANIATTGAFQVTMGGGGAYLSDAFIAKLDRAGNRQWSTYYGGAYEDVSRSIARDSSGKLYIAGYTNSLSGLATTGSYQPAGGGGYDVFLAKLDTSGQRVWATYYGGTGDDAWAILAIHCDQHNNLYIAGQTNSPNGIATPGTYRQALYAGLTDQDAFLAKFDTAGQRLWGTYFGGNFGDAAYAVTADSSGNIYLAGTTNSTAGIATAGSQQNTNAGNYDAFLARFTGMGSLSWSTYLGGDGDDYGLSLACDDSAHIYLAGLTASTTGLVSPGAYQTAYGGGYQDGLIAKFTNTGALTWATYYGGSSEDQCDQIIPAPGGGVYICGFTGSDTGITTVGVPQAVLGGYYDAFVSRFSTSGDRVWGNYIGGADAEEAYTLAKGNGADLYIAGNTMSATGIATGNTGQGTFGGGDYDGFLIHMKDCNPPVVIGSISGSQQICAGTTHTYTLTPVPGASAYTWLLPAGWTGSSTADSINVTFNGNSDTLRAIAVNDCYHSDTVSLFVMVNPVPLVPVIVQNGYLLSVSGSFAAYQWNRNGIAVPGAVNATYTVSTSGSYSVTVSNTEGCSNTSGTLDFTLTAINNQLEQNGIRIYPNPVKDRLFVHCPLKATASLFSVEGRVLQTFPLQAGNNILPMTACAPGRYLLRLSDSKGNPLGTQKLLKSFE